MIKLGLEVDKKKLGFRMLLNLNMIKRYTFYKDNYHLFQDVVKFEYDKTSSNCSFDSNKFQDVVKFEYDKTWFKSGQLHLQFQDVVKFEYDKTFCVIFS